MYPRLPCENKTLIKKYIFYIVKMKSQPLYMFSMSVANMIIIMKEIVPNGKYNHDYGYDLCHMQQKCLDYVIMTL